MKTKEIDMLNGNIVKSVLLFTIPMMLSGILQSLYNAADMIVVGQFVGDNALAAVGATATIYGVIINLFMGFSVGIDVVCSFCHGAGDEDGVRETVHTAVIAALILGAGVFFVGWFATPALLTLMKTPTEAGVYDGAVTYLRIVFIGAPFTVFYNFCAAILRTAGDTRRPFFYLASCGALNVVLNIFFVTVCQMGVAGVATSTALTQGLSALLIFVRLCRMGGIFSFSFRHLRFSASRFTRIFYIGILAGVQNAIFSISNSFLQSAVNTFGPAAMAGNTAVDTVENLLWVTCSSFQYAAVTFISKNVSAGKPERVRKIFLVTLLFAVGTALFFGGICRLFARTVISVFIRGGEEAMTYALGRASITFPLYFLAGCMSVLPSVIRGLGHSVSPTIVNLVTVCGVRIGWVYTVFRLFPRISTLYIVHPLTWALTSAVLLIIYFVNYRRFVKTVTPAPAV